MFNWLFKKNYELSKIGMWQKFELFDLFNDLEQVNQILSKPDIPSVRAFYKEFEEEFYDLKYQNFPDFKHICIWFAPNSNWNDFIGSELGNRIYERAYKWNEANFDKHL